MKSLVLGGVVLGLGLVAGSGRAQQLEVAGRLGYQMATGKLAEAPPDAPANVLDLSESVSGEVPIGFEIGARLVPMLALGAYVDFAPGIISSEASDACDALDHDCAAFGFHIGVMTHVHILPEGAVDPWLGFGIGAEGLAFAESFGEHTITASFGGIEFPFRAGVDFKLAERFALGPYVGYTLGTFSTVAYKCEGPDCTLSELEDEIQDTASHGWFGFGAKLTILAL